mmetsp:Transcript_38521/g.59467  ORF Transcript_38521/g.59467 Transcript_38521/m.59467 type:complete len:81 (+) Transcript_38521:426-668(+)|eukprot:CAMPEP_0117025398 /NCGR_PEP_ID=MMETSP0472-20121206/18764_1 /TAXON_ID=693140 ORGANISM="Tiarina fusus, Strain LIS" /NCGR_SAMPLE_ID=MMETSP0472 /ASSEMBLY_ACC=CAM_ASM_000603 /LENGTH=80 /DNA_ID=CAMNT_0004732099 /DNA_START=421 /DNA_END=663 /DNA_ORIENTATION=-
MGCTQSGEADTRLQTVDDSVHVMLAHDKKVQQQKGQKPHGYVPRAEHPLLKPKEEGAGAGAEANSNGEGTTNTNETAGGQ